MTNRLRIDLDLSDFYEALNVIEGPGPETLAALDVTLQAGYAQTQVAVHVITGSLKASGRTEVEYEPGSEVWQGDIVYGGPSPGSVNNPVEYAEYERARGGSHNYFANLPLLYDQFEEAVFASVEARL